MNKAIVCGHLGQDPEKSEANGTTVVKLSVATTELVKDGEKKTEWHKVTVWGKAAESAAKYLKKGSKVLVEGRLRTTSWEQDLGDGQKVKKSQTTILASSVEYLDSKPK